MRTLTTRRSLGIVVIATATMLLLAAQGGAAAPPPTTTAAPTAAAAEPTLLRAALASHLTGPHFDYWLDPRNYVRERLVIQARRLYYLSTMATDPLSCEGPLAASKRRAVAAAADAAFLEMSSKFRQPEGGWRFWLDADPSHNRPQQVAMYGQVFALYALSTYAAAGVVASSAGGGGAGAGAQQQQQKAPLVRHAADARSLAHNTFDEIVARLGPDGAVEFEAYMPDFKTPLPGGMKANAVGSDGVRALGTHLHLLEALIAYRRLLLAEEQAAAAAGTTAAKTATAAILKASGWTPERRAASRSVLERAAALLLSMRQGYLVLELRDQGDARLPAPLLAADATGGQGYLPGHGVQAAFQLWDALEVLSKDGGDKGSSANVTKPAVLEFATAMLDGARMLEQQGSGVVVVAADNGGGAASSPPPASYSWLPHIYRLDRIWQLKREAERVVWVAAASPDALLSPRRSLRRRRRGAKAAAVDDEEQQQTPPPSPLPPPPQLSALHVGYQKFEAEINWWSQMEHMLALLRTAKELAAHDPQRAAYDARAADAWRLLSKRFADRKTGAFHWSVDQRTLIGEGPTSSAWKASYHSSRAMVNGIRSLCSVATE